MTDRRDFLKLAAASTGAAIGLGVMPSAIREALAIPASRVTARFGMSSMW